MAFCRPVPISLMAPAYHFVTGPPYELKSGPTRRKTMPYATTDDGVKLYYEETGAGAPVVFVHEFAADHRSWEMQMRHFGQRYRCITFSARGYPPSDVPEKPASYSQNRATDDILAVMDHLKIAQGPCRRPVDGRLRHPAFRLPPSHARAVAGRGRRRLRRGEGAAGEVQGRGRGRRQVAAERGHGEVRREIRLRPDARAVREQGPARLRPVQEGARRAFGAGLGQHPGRRAGPAARRSTTFWTRCAP